MHLGPGCRRVEGSQICYVSREDLLKRLGHAIAIYHCCSKCLSAVSTAGEGNHKLFCDRGIRINEASTSQTGCKQTTTRNVRLSGWRIAWHRFFRTVFS
jgi:hypothetical protein